MAVEYDIQVKSQNSIYGDSKEESTRNLNVYFCIPDAGTNPETGILLLIAGFGGTATSNVYKKMRKLFADKYNLVTIQCDYFGFEFMKEEKKFTVENANTSDYLEFLKNYFTVEEIQYIYSDSKFNLDKLLEIGKGRELTISALANLDTETVDNFNEMGIMQALDNITAVINVMSLLYENDYCFNSKKVIAYGQSQGSYLAYLCNAYAPKLFSLIIDNSAWLFPLYIAGYRQAWYEFGKIKICVSYNYLAKSLVRDYQIIDLNYLYSKFSNKCNVIVYHGVNDNLISHTEKKEFCKKSKRIVYNEVTGKDIDGVMIKSLTHGLEADFILLFCDIYENIQFDFEKGKEVELFNVTYKTGLKQYEFDYSNITPVVKLG